MLAVVCPPLNVLQPGDAVLRVDSHVRSRHHEAVVVGEEVLGLLCDGFLHALVHLVFAQVRAHVRLHERGSVLRVELAEEPPGHGREVARVVLTVVADLHRRETVSAVELLDDFKPLVFEVENAVEVDEVARNLLAPDISAALAGLAHVELVRDDPAADALNLGLVERKAAEAFVRRVLGRDLFEELAVDRMPVEVREQLEVFLKLLNGKGLHPAGRIVVAGEEVQGVAVAVGDLEEAGRQNHHMGLSDGRFEEVVFEVFVALHLVRGRNHRLTSEHVDDEVRKVERSDGARLPLHAGVDDGLGFRQKLLVGAPAALKPILVEVDLGHGVRREGSFGEGRNSPARERRRWGCRRRPSRGCRSGRGRCLPRSRA